MSLCHCATGWGVRRGKGGSTTLCHTPPWICCSPGEIKFQYVQAQCTLPGIHCSLTRSSSKFPILPCIYHRVDEQPAHLPRTCKALRNSRNWSRQSPDPRGVNCLSRMNANRFSGRATIDETPETLHSHSRTAYFSCSGVQYSCGC